MEVVCSGDKKQARTTVIRGLRKIANETEAEDTAYKYQLDNDLPSADSSFRKRYVRVCILKQTIASLVLVFILFPALALGETVKMKDLVKTNGL